MSRSTFSTATTYISLLVPTILLLLSAQFTDADCECGYRSAINSDSYVFTDLIESDFLHLGNISHNTDWIQQQYNVTAKASRGVYGTAFQVSDLVSNPLVAQNSYNGTTVNGEGDPGLQLYVRGGIPTDGYVPTSQLDSTRTDLLWGSYRAAMKLTDVPGTCGAFFWYFNDSQEIDMEFLSSEFNAGINSFPVNLVMQSSKSAAQGYQNIGKNFIVANLPFDPTRGYHEYRIDFIPGNVIFYADSHVLANMNTSAVPTEAGHLILEHWSNGGSGWSYGPPVTDAVLAVSYVKAYFNSSLASRQTDLTLRCKNSSAPNAVCAIPDQVVAPNPDSLNGNVTANTLFFSDIHNATFNQTVYHQSGTAANRVVRLLVVVQYVWMVLILGVMGLWRV
ncbi:MAG: hypothetical protein M1818_007328 [Claussenomyces sp. TS43310]|nr:MAG: hypothetical protein M1818_007328 [Claussenomyces sp. TS43310]